MTVCLLVFAYNRPAHFDALMRSLSSCRELDSLRIRLVCDGPRKADDLDAVREVQRHASDWSARLGCELIARSNNRGLAASVREEVTSALVEAEAVIVVEDDLVVAPDFIRFHLAALDHYRLEDRVMQVSGFRHIPPDGSNRTSLLPVITSWGWSTWRRAWGKFDWEASGWTDATNKVRWAFNCRDAYDFSWVLDGRLKGENESWGIMWYWTVFRENGLVVYPPQNLVDNTGFDGSGVHCSNSDVGVPPIADAGLRWEWSPSVRVDRPAYRRVCKWLRRFAKASVGAVPKSGYWMGDLAEMRERITDAFQKLLRGVRKLASLRGVAMLLPLTNSISVS